MTGGDIIFYQYFSFSGDMVKFDVTVYEYFN